MSRLAIIPALSFFLIIQLSYAQDFALIKDINGGSAHSNITEAVPLPGAGITIFVADNGINGVELWKTDGTTEGTIIVKDINEGAGNSSPAYLTLYNGLIYFAANDGENGTELWKTDGTEVGTVMVKDITADAMSSSPQSLVVSNGLLFFSATTAAYGRELWKSNGTSGGTVIIADIADGNVVGIPGGSMIGSYKNKVYFPANDPGLSLGVELWSSDGTLAGTSLHRDINTGTPSSSPSNFASVRNCAGSETFLYFSANDGSKGTELWKTNGSTVTLEEDINPGSGSSSPANLTPAFYTMFYSASISSTQGNEPRSVSTLFDFVDIYSGTLGSSPMEFSLVGGHLFFSANEPTHGRELWEISKQISVVATLCGGVHTFEFTDFDPVLVKDINTSGSSTPKAITGVNDVIMMGLDDGAGQGHELFKMLAIEPASSPTAMVVGDRTVNSINASFTASASTTGYIVLMRPGSAPTGLPVDGTYYSPGDVIGNSTVAAIGNAASFATGFTVSGLTAQTNYFFAIYSYKYTSTTADSEHTPIDINYRTTSPLTGNAYTLSLEPATHPGLFNSSTSTSVELSFSAASTITNADGYIILRGPGNTVPPVGDITDGKDPGTLTLSPDVILLTSVTDPAKTTLTDNTVLPGVKYNYLIIPYNSSGVNQTYNYKTDGAVKTTSATPAPSQASDIALETFTFPANIPYADYQADDLTPATSIEVGRFRLRDGGNSPDADIASTVLNSLSFTTTNAGAIRKAALYDGSAEFAEVAPSGGSVSFTGLPITAADNNSKVFSLRVSFTPAVSDNLQFSFQVASATTSPAGSGLASADAGAVITSTAGDNNRIEVSATKIVYTTQPPSLATVNTSISPAAALEARDALNNKDIDYNGAATVTNSASLSLANAPVAFSSGSISFTGLKFTSFGTTTITVSSGALTNATSDAITVFASEPTEQPASITFTNITINSLQGSFDAPSTVPTGYVVLRKASSEPLDLPVDGTEYTAGLSIGESLVIDTDGDLTFNDAGLDPGITYFYKVFAYNGSDASINYSTADPLSGDQSTIVGEPSIKPTNILFSDVSTTSMRVSFTASAGNAAGYLVLRKAGSAPTELPVDGVTYSGIFGESDVVYMGPETTFMSTGLSPAVIYHYAVFTFNGSNVLINYLSNDPLTGNRTTFSEEPDSQPTAFLCTEVSASSMAISFTAPSPAPTGYIVLRSTSEIADLPGDGTTYDAGSTIGSSIVVYSGPGTAFTSSALSAGTNYFYTVYAFNGSSQSTNYLLSSPLSGQKRTKPAAPVAENVVGQTSNYFKATWLEVAGAVRYLLDVSKDESFTSRIAGYDSEPVAALFRDVNGLDPDTQYFFRVRAENESGISSYSNSVSVKTVLAPGPDPDPEPEPDDIVMSNPSVGISQINITVTGGAEDMVVKFYSKGILEPGDAWQSVAITGSGTNYSRSFTVSDLDELGMEYYFEAEDSLNEPVRSPANGNGFIYRTIAANEKAIPFASGFSGDQKTYQMFSIPYELENANVNAIFSVQLDGEDKNQWRLFHFEDRENKEYPNQFIQIEHGKGYWFNTFKTAFTISVGKGTVVDRNQQTPFVMTLKSGWNQIGNPYPFDISWSTVAGNSDNVSELNFWSNGAYTSRDVFRPWEGAFVFNSSATAIQLHVPVTAKSNGRTMKNELSHNIDEDAWELGMELTAAGLTHNSGIGMHPDASMSKDRHDKITLPNFIDYAVMDVRHDEFFAPNFAVDVVPTGASHVWRFDVRSNLDGEPMDLRWDNTSIQKSDAALILVDETGRRWVDMKTTDHYTTTIRNGTQLTVLFSKNGEIDFGKTLMGDAYPNPFHKEAYIPVLVGDNLSVRIELYDLLGKKLRTLHQEFSKPGFHSLYWDGTDDNGSAASGMIFYRMPGGETKRLIRQ